MGKIMRRGVNFSGGSWSGSEVSLVPITNGYLDITETVTIPDYMDYDEIIILMKSTGTGWGWEISLYPKHEVAIADSYHSACTGIYLNETLNVYLFANLNIETHVLSITQQKPESDAYAANKYTVIGRKRSYVSGGSSNSAENIKYDDTKNVKEAIDEVNSNLEELSASIGSTPDFESAQSVSLSAVGDSFTPTKRGILIVRYTASAANAVVELSLSGRSYFRVAGVASGVVGNMPLDAYKDVPIAVAAIRDITLSVTFIPYK